MCLWSVCKLSVVDPIPRPSVSNIAGSHGVGSRTENAAFPVVSQLSYLARSQLSLAVVVLFPAPPARGPKWGACFFAGSANKRSGGLGGLGD